jgi:hypothetical protein
MTETTIEKRFYTHPCFHQEAYAPGAGSICR